ncbi:MAG: DEAD/DEAH box helicase, partial [Lachnospiraceae bacterium]|nr:DEAD/DEAH box helicase [Lachnospiraceae bacterium]
MRALTEPLRQTDKYGEAAKLLQENGGHVLIDGCASSQKLHLAYTLSSDPEVMEGGARYTLVLTYSDLCAHQLAEEYSFYNRNTYVFPTKDLIFYQADLRGREIERERLICLKRILEGKSAAVFTTFAALMTPLMPLSLLKDSILSVRKRQALPLDKASAALTAMGYEKTYQVEAPGQFAIRGDILDIFDLTRENPCRIELWGDEVDQIRSFDVLSQRSVEELHSIDIFPATEMILRSDRLADGLARMKKECDAAAERFKRDGHVQEAHRLTEEIEQAAEQAREWGSYDSLESYIHYFYPHTEGFLSLFPQGNTMLFLDEPARVEEQANAVSMEFKESMLVRAEKGLILPGLMEFLTPVGTIAEETENFRRAGLTELAQNTSVFPSAPLVSIRAREIAPYNRSFSSLLADLKQYRKEKYRVVLFSFSRSRAKSLASELTEEGVSAFYSENPSRVLEDGEIMTYFGPIRHGFAYPACRLVVIAESDIFGGRARKRKKTKKFEGERIRDFTDLSVGDYVVHETHGIGIYRGIEKVEIDHIEKDYIKIEYAGGGTLYVLPTELDVLQKYAAQDAAKPKINKLGTQEWTNVRKKVQRAVEEIADDLVQLYAVRQQRKGHVFERDTVWQREFEELFPFEETDDQLRAIEDTKRDMESERIMDRLICGDVGYGKTEIAIRAAFKAVQDSMQAAVLVPTTILAQQHYNTFVERMKNYPVRIGLLSRFRTAAEQKKTIRALEKGEVDIVIGTHRLLSADVHFKNLGLLVVDEEQRFGVTHKEKIKKLKEDVDVLTLTATPIPRTLHMSLVGIRDMSVLEEAPEDRVPIQTYIMEYNEEMVREAILREISRGGQVYYVYNRVNDIAEVTG